jgi:hypothetical protein
MCALLQRIIAGTQCRRQERYEFLRKVHIQCGGKILHTCLNQSTQIRPLSVQEHLSGHRLRKEQALTREKYAKCAWSDGEPGNIDKSKPWWLTVLLNLLRMSMLLSRNTTNQRGFRAVQEVKAKNGDGKPPSAGS